MSEIKKWIAPAKINHFLHITGQRSDGYHTLQTVFQFVSLFDYLSFRLREDRQIRNVMPCPGVEPDQDLSTQAAVLLQSRCDVQVGVDIRLEKNIPTGAGLGGGSSDAATTLVALNHLWKTDLTTDKLMELALELGADVPVFVKGLGAWAEGVGELLTPITLPESWFVIIVPACHISTANIFSRRELTRNSSPITISQFLEEGGGNVCQPVAVSLYPEVGEALAWLSCYGTAKMSGTGASIFASFAEENEALAVKEKVPRQWDSHVVQGLSASPLLKQR